MTRFDDFLNEQLKNPDFKKEWDALQPEMTIVKAMIEARQVKGLTQQELSKKTGIAQPDISKLEKGKGNPTIKMLQRLADGMDMELKIDFVPKYKGVV